MNKIFNCKTCGKSFTTLGDLKRHNTSFNAATVIKYQCWHCPNIYARKESAKNHALKIHDEKKTVRLTTDNKCFRLEIFRPEAWTPPPEARPSTIYKIMIPTTSGHINSVNSQINKIKQRRRITRLDPYIALTAEEAMKNLQ